MGSDAVLLGAVGPPGGDVGVPAVAATAGPDAAPTDASELTEG